MKPDFFWRSWDKQYRLLYQILLSVFICAVIVYAFSYLAGSSFVISWEIENLIDPVNTLLQSYRLGIFEFPININNYVISQSFIGSELSVNVWPAYVLLIWLGIFFSLMMALISDLSRFWFVVSVILFTVIFVGLKLDYLVLFNSYQKIGLLVVFALYFPSLYIFHFVKMDIGFIPRFLTHIAATIIFGLVIYFFSHVNLPFLHLANYGVFVPVLLTVLFSFIIGHEIVSGFLRVITSGALSGEKNSLVHFLVISIIFLINGVLLILRNSGKVDLDIYFIGSFWLLTIGAVIGIWGYRAKEQTYEGMFPFYPFGAFLFIGLAITAHLTIAYIFVIGNDSFMEVFEDAIIFSQLGYSSMFVIYVLANFFDLIKHNVNVGKVLYKPRRMPYFISRFAGVVVIMALFFRFNMDPYFQSVAGYYSGIGDLYLEAEDYLSAEEYYKISNNYSGTSHRANYAMATIERRNGNSTEEIKYLQQAVRKHPTAFSYANLASKYMESKRYFNAVFALQDGLKEFPENGQLLNNLGLAYLEMNNVDSAYYYLEGAQFESSSFNEAAANIYALLSKESLSIKSDTLGYLLNQTEDLSAINNLVVLANQRSEKAADNGALNFGDANDTELVQLIYNYNKSINDPWIVDASYQKQMQVFYDSSNTSWFQDNLNLASAIALYQQGEISSSLEKLNHLAIQNPEKEYYSLLGKLTLRQQANGLAIDYFKSAFQNGRLEIAPELAFAYMEYGELDKAAFIWKQIELIGDSINTNTARKMITVIDASDISEIINADTETRFSYLAYRYKEADLSELEGLVLSFDSEDIQAMGFLKLFNAYLELKEHPKALQLLEEVGRLNISRSDVLEDINLAQCKYAYKAHDDEMMQRLHSNMKSDDLLVLNYLELFESIEGLKTRGAETVISNFDKLGTRNPFFEDGVLESVRYFNEEINVPDKAYEILLNAVSINPFSLEFNKAYAFQCLRIGLVGYALDAKEELKTMMPSVVYKTFELEFDAFRVEIESKSTDW